MAPLIVLVASLLTLRLLGLAVPAFPAEVAATVARGTLDQATMAMAAQLSQAAAEEAAVGDPAGWLSGWGWRVHLYDVAERFAAYGRELSPGVAGTLNASASMAGHREPRNCVGASRPPPRGVSARVGVCSNVKPLGGGEQHNLAHQRTGACLRVHRLQARPDRRDRDDMQR
jgi:hypothetical protein